MADDFDIIITGAGIAGTACALRCARQDFRSCCLNAANFPAVKIFPAGGCIAMRLPNFFLIFSNPLHLNGASPRKVWP
ncbi:FAD-binding protein [Citrobacter portucalensis]